MALKKILCFPDSRLRLKAKKVNIVDNKVKTLINDMLETLYSSPYNIGLAAIQINVQLAIMVMDVSSKRNQTFVFINPEIIEKSGEKVEQEGCLSVPGIYEKVRRFAKIKVKALDKKGKPLELEAEGLLSACIQHELDHLEGKLFIDYLSPLKKQLIKRKLKKIQRTSL